MWSRRALALFSLLPVAVMQAPYWGDELIVLKLIERWDLWGVLTVLPVWQPHYPTWYLLPELAGPYAAEAVSVACVPLAVWWTMGAAEELYDPGSAWLAGLLLACSPFVAAQGGWLRMYSMLTALSALTLYLGLAGDRKASWSALGAAALHPFGAIVPLWNAIVTRSRGSLMALAATGSAAVMYAIVKLSRPHTMPSRSAMTDKTSVGHGVVPSWYELLATPGGALAGSPRFRMGVLAAVTITVVSLHTDRRVALWTAGVPVIILAASAIVHPVWEFKYFGFIAPAVAVGLADPRSGRWRWAGVAAFAVLAALNFYLSQLGAPVAHRMYFWFL